MKNIYIQPHLTSVSITGESIIAESIYNEIGDKIDYVKEEIDWEENISCNFVINSSIWDEEW